MALVNPRQDGDKVCGDGGKAQRRRGELVGGGGVGKEWGSPEMVPPHGGSLGGGKQ
jgi:hypothetical protein